MRNTTKDTHASQGALRLPGEVLSDSIGSDINGRGRNATRNGG